MILSKKLKQNHAVLHLLALLAVAVLTASALELFSAPILADTITEKKFFLRILYIAKKQTYQSCFDVFLYKNN